MVISWPAILVEVVIVYIAILIEIVVAELQFKDTGTTLMGLKLGVTQRNFLLIPLKTSSPEIGMLE
jgi:hypothetical protein